MSEIIDIPEIDRYEMHVDWSGCEMRKHDYGEWIDFDDYEKIANKMLAENQQLAKQNAESLQALREIISKTEINASQGMGEIGSIAAKTIGRQNRKNIVERLKGFSEGIQSGEIDLTE